MIIFRCWIFCLQRYFIIIPKYQFFMMNLVGNSIVMRFKNILILWYIIKCGSNNRLKIGLTNHVVHEQIFTLLSSFHMSWIVILCVYVRCQSCLKVIMHVQINHNYRYVSKAQFKNFMSIAHRGQHCNYIFSKSSNKIIWYLFVPYRFVCCFNFDNEWDDFEN